MAKWLKNIISLILGTIIGGILYRMGGAAGYNTKFRDFGIPIISILVFLLWIFPYYHFSDLSLILTFGAIFGAQTTYLKKKGEDAKWWNWFLVGLLYSITWLPTVIIQNIWPPLSLHTHWIGFSIRTIICTWMTVWISEMFGNVVYEENGRGWVEILTIPLLFIG